MHTFAAVTLGEQTLVEARRGDAIAWTATLTGGGGPLITTHAAVIAALGGTTVAGLALRGEPGAALVALDRATGAASWKLAIDASEWAVISAIAALGDEVVVAGSFSGTLRAATKTVSTAGKGDGFLARVTSTGDVAWLVRMGGPGADAILGVATAGTDRIAITGTFAPGADLLGVPFASYDDKSPRADGFVADLDGHGALHWAHGFGGKLDDSVVGVAIDDAGRVAVAASVREVIKIGATELVARGDADGAVAWWSKEGVPGPAVQLGGADFDGVRAITAIGKRIVVGGFFSGTMRLGQRELVAGGGDDAYLAAFDHGELVALWSVTGEGREEIAALASVPGGFLAAVTHTARATIEGTPLPAPHDPTGGASLVIRPVP